MPMRTPGMRKGSHKRTLNILNRLHGLHGREFRGEYERVAIKKLMPMTRVAESAASKTEFQRADWPAANAPGSSDQVRLVEANWTIGSPRERTLSPRAKAV